MSHIAIVAVGENVFRLLKNVASESEVEQTRAEFENLGDSVARKRVSYTMSFDLLSQNIDGIVSQAEKVARITSFVQNNPGCVETVEGLDDFRKKLKQARSYLKSVERLIDASLMVFHNCGTVQDCILTLGSFGIEWGRVQLSSLEVPDSIKAVFETRKLRTLGGLLEFTRTTSLETVGLSEHEIEQVANAIRDLIRDLCNTAGRSDEKA